MARGAKSQSITKEAVSAAPLVRTRKARAVGLSRERIVAESLRYLREHPDEPLTVARAAATVGATPMAIYRHFRDGADLADAIVAVVLGGLADEIPSDADWRTQVRAWMEILFQRLIETPQAGSMLSTSDGLTEGWIRAAAALRRSLAFGGFEGTALSQAVFWVSMAVTGYARQALNAPLERQIDGTLRAIERLGPDESKDLASFAADVPGIYANALEIILERTLASLDALLATSTAKATNPNSRARGRTRKRD